MRKPYENIFNAVAALYIINCLGVCGQVLHIYTMSLSTYLQLHYIILCITTSVTSSLTPNKLPTLPLPPRTQTKLYMYENYFLTFLSNK